MEKIILKPDQEEVPENEKVFEIQEMTVKVKELTIAELEFELAEVNEHIDRYTTRKSELEAKIAEFKKLI